MSEILDSKSAVGVCELPTGINHDGRVLKEIFFREMSGEEEDIFANKKMSFSKKFSLVMSNCIKKFGDVEDRSVINRLVDKMVETDRIFFLIQLRIHSVDKVFEFKTTCPQCGNEDDVIFDLDQIKIVNPPSPEKLFKEVKLPSGNTVRIKVADGKVEEIIEKAMNEKNAISLALMARIEEIGGRPATLHDVISMHLKDRKSLREAIDGFEGEIDDKFKATCPKCGHEHTGTVPISSPDFLFV